MKSVYFIDILKTYSIIILIISSFYCFLNIILVKFDNLFIKNCYIQRKNCLDFDEKVYRVLQTFSHEKKLNLFHIRPNKLRIRILFFQIQRKLEHFIDRLPAI